MGKNFMILDLALISWQIWFDTKSIGNKAKINNWNYIKQQTDSQQSEKTSEMGENIFKLSDKRLMSRIHKQFL